MHNPGSSAYGNALKNNKHFGNKSGQDITPNNAIMSLL